VVFPLIITAITGFSYRWGRNAFGIPKEDIGWLLNVHQARFSIESLPIFYTLFNAAGLLFLASSGYTMIKSFVWNSTFTWRKPTSYRDYHQIVASLGIITLSITAATGVAFCWALDVLGMEPTAVKFLMTLHQGSIFPGLTLLWTLFNAFSLLSLASSGLTMLPWFRRYFLSNNTTTTLH